MILLKLFFVYVCLSVCVYMYVFVCVIFSDVSHGYTGERFSECSQFWHVGTWRHSCARSVHCSSLPL